MLAGLTRLYPILALISGLAILTFMVWFAHVISHPNHALALSQLEFIAIDSNTPPEGRSDWQSVSLPDDWYHSNRKNQNGWYRYRFTLKVAPNRLWGIYLPTVQQNAAVFLNGELLGDGGRFTAPIARNWNRPLYFTIPNGLLQPDSNTLAIRIKSNPPKKGLLSKVFLGPAEFLQVPYNIRYFLRYTLTQFIILLLVSTSIVMLMLWWLRRSDTIYAAFAIPLIFWSVHILNLVIINIPVSTRAWDWLMFSSIIWFPVFATCFIQRFIGSLNKKIEHISFIIAFLLCLILLLLPDDSFYWAGARVTDTLALTFGLYPVYCLYRHVRINPQVDAFQLMFTGFLLILFGFHDVLVVNHLISRVDGYFLHYSAPPGLLLFGHILLKRFVNALNESEELNQNLEIKIEANRIKLEKSFQDLKDMDRQRVLAEERERLMRDMHDGMGGHLVSTLALLEGKNIDNNSLRAALQSALDDLRLMIDSMEDVDGDVLTVLAMLRERLEPRLNQAGIRIDWQVDDIPALPDLGPENALQMLRIFQEAITNVLKHACADRLTFHTRLKTSETGQAGVHIECRDNGKGLPEKTRSAHPMGRGLNNINKRAESLGGIAGIENAEEGGVRVWLWIPIVDN